MEEGSGIWEGLAGDFERLRREEHIPRGRNVSRLRDSKAQSCKEESGVDKNSGREREKESHGQQCVSLKVKYSGHRWRVRRKKCEISHWQFWHRRDLKTWRRPAENSWQCFRTRFLHLLKQRVLLSSGPFLPSWLLFLFLWENTWRQHLKEGRTDFGSQSKAPPTTIGKSSRPELATAHIREKRVKSSGLHNNLCIFFSS